jgi:hypothetical protein
VLFYLTCFEDTFTEFILSLVFLILSPPPIAATAAAVTFATTRSLYHQHFSSLAPVQWRENQFCLSASLKGFACLALEFPYNVACNILYILRVLGIIIKSFC